MKILTAGLFALALMAGISQANAQEIEIKFGHVGEPGSLMADVSQEFAKRANEQLEGEAKVTVYGSSQLGGDSELLKKLKLGTVDLALPSTVMSSVAPQFALFEMPYLIADRDHMKRVRDEVVRPMLYPVAESRGYHIIGVWENGFRQITNNVRPINKPADLQGIKLRVPKGVWRVEMFKSYGANPSPMALSEVFVALQTGAMDGQENPLVQTYASRLQEVQQYLSLSGHVYTPAYVTAGMSWNRLPEHVREVLKQTAEEMESYALEQGAKLDEETLQKMRDAGLEINEVDRQAFIDASKPVYDKFIKDVDGGQEMLDKVREL
ncbi:TRAP transporter substrate-binding protein [Salinicola peritrichatus]|uniref:TRAP transporter substrate-binding protein n=1 Tax=Salinicola peritrichatus TaxID=1267424 RepID=UPI000DA146BF|nr:TRAP transporter substrate-binding protein [Salinicola peritrichatus]